MELGNRGRKGKDRGWRQRCRRTHALFLFRVQDSTVLIFKFFTLEVIFAFRGCSGPGMRLEYYIKEHRRICYDQKRYISCVYFPEDKAWIYALAHLRRPSHLSQPPLEAVQECTPMNRTVGIFLKLFPPRVVRLPSPKPRYSTVQECVFCDHFLSSKTPE